MQRPLDNKAENGARKEFDNNRKKRSRFTKKSEVTVHQWTFSTQVK
ncbi:hypothetical protein [Anditalea andensis]|nr:hypothetical protein [Anditalea andensis]